MMTGNPQGISPDHTSRQHCWPQCMPTHQYTTSTFSSRSKRKLINPTGLCEVLSLATRKLEETNSWTLLSIGAYNICQSHSNGGGSPWDLFLMTTWLHPVRCIITGKLGTNAKHVALVCTLKHFQTAHFLCTYSGCVPSYLNISLCYHSQPVMSWMSYHLIPRVLCEYNLIPRVLCELQPHSQAVLWVTTSFPGCSGSYNLIPRVLYE